MIEFKTDKPRISLTLDGQAEITFKTHRNALKDLETLKEGELIVQVKKYAKRRSLSQNAYLWVLLNEIAIKTDNSKIEVYQSYIKDYGTFEIIPIKNEAVGMFKNRWGKNGLGWFCEDLGESKLNGFTKLIAYYGSSTYTTEEMKRVLEAVIQDCEELGISTMTWSDIALLNNEND